MNINFLSWNPAKRMFKFPALSYSNGIGMKEILLVLICIAIACAGRAQDPLSRFRGMGGHGSSRDSLEHRKNDTISLTFRYLDSSRLQKLDSEIYNFYLRYPLPQSFIDFGNIGTASHDLIFNPFLKPGWDGGWHAYDPYVFTVEQSRF